jgi:hypothetical protein
MSEQIPYPRLMRLGKTHKLTEVEKLKIREFRIEGWTFQRIADELEISPDTARYHFNEERRKRVMETARERFRMMSEDDLIQKRARAVIHKRRKLELQPVEMRLHYNPNAKMRRIPNELFLRLYKKPLS